VLLLLSALLRLGEPIAPARQIARVRRRARARARLGDGRDGLELLAGEILRLGLDRSRARARVHEHKVGGRWASAAALKIARLSSRSTLSQLAR
jgi:hypothetical protein